MKYRHLTISKIEIKMYMKMYNVEFDVAKKLLEDRNKKANDWYLQRKNSGCLYNWNEKHINKGVK